MKFKCGLLVCLFVFPTTTTTTITTYYTTTPTTTPTTPTTTTTTTTTTTITTITTRLIFQLLRCSAWGGEQRSSFHPGGEKQCEQFHPKPKILKKKFYASKFFFFWLQIIYGPSLFF